MKKFAYTLTPKNGNHYDCRDSSHVLVNAMSDFQSLLKKKDAPLTFLSRRYEHCSKGKSKGKFHCHGVLECNEDDISTIKKIAKVMFGGQRPLDIIPLYNPLGWTGYINKDQNMFLKKNAD